MKLKEAIEVYKKEEKTPSNAYSWYRKDAKDRGEVFIGEKHIKAIKIGNQWYINDNDFKKSIKSHRKRIALLKKKC